MKKIITLLIVLFLTGTSTIGQIPTNGLIGWWAFNGNPNDLSGFGHNGTVNGASLTTDRFGVTNSAYYCPHSCYIEVPNYPINTAEISVSGWFKTSDGARIFQHNFNDPNGSFLIHCPSGYQTQGMLCLPGNSSHITITSTIATNNNLWHHVVLVKSSSSTSAKLYIDGVLTGTYTSPFTLNNGITSLFFGNPETVYNMFAGSVDDIRIYNRELTQSEVTSLFNESSTYTITTSSNPTNGGSTTGNGTYQTGSQVTVVATPNSGWSFTNWTENGNVVSTSSSYSFFISGNRNLVANFIQIQSITVTSPNGGETWYAGCSHDITWTSSGVTNVKIEYSYDNGSTWLIIVNNYPASTASYTWIVPNTPSLVCKVKISDVNNLSDYDISDSPFTITSGSNSINGLVAWYPFNGNANDMSGYGNNGTVNGATLTTDRFGNTNSAYYFNGNSNIMIGSSSSLNLRNNVSVSVWIKSETANLTASSAQIVFRGDPQDAHDPYYLNFSNGSLGFRRYVSTGYQMVETAFPGSTLNTVNFYHIVGTYDSITGAMKIYLNGAIQNQITTLNYLNYPTSTFWNAIGSEQSGSAQNYHGVIDDVRIYNRALTQSEVNQLYNEPPSSTITVTSPNGFESWQVGSTHNITWSTTDITNVKIEYSYDNGSSWQTVVNGYPASTGFYSWIVPNTPSTICKVKISDANNLCHNDLSDNTFTITGGNSSILVLSPNGGEIWQVGSNYNIAWTSTGVSFVNIDFTIDNGSNWISIITNLPASSNSSYLWTVPNNPSNQCKVRITDASNSSTSDQSDNVFTILGGGSAITVISPNGNEIWQVGLPYYIIWNSSNVSNVRIDYSVDNGFSWIPIVYSTPANIGYYSWVVPDTPSSTCLMKVSDASNPAFFDESDADFTISLLIGIDEHDSQFKIFPNPTTGYVKVESDHLIASIEVFSSMGLQVSKEIFNKKRVILDLTNYAKGVYYLQISSGKGLMTKKVVVL